jgi:hypothetical protein
MAPLQLSTDSQQKMFPFLESKGKLINDKRMIGKIFDSEAFADLMQVNIMPLIYRETEKQCNIMIFDIELAMKKTEQIIYIGRGESYFDKGQGKSRKHPIYLFVDKSENYICEVRYGGASANALQRGFWTHTKNAVNYFDSLTNGWIDYSHNQTLVRLFSLALNSTEHGHLEASKILQKDIEKAKFKK